MFLTEITACNLQIVFRGLTEMWMETITCTCRRCSLRRGLSAALVFFNKTTSPQLSACDESKRRRDPGQISLPLFRLIYESRTRLRHLVYLLKVTSWNYSPKQKGLVVNVMLTVVFCDSCYTLTVIMMMMMRRMIDNCWSQHKKLNYPIYCGHVHSWSVINFTSETTFLSDDITNPSL